MEQMDLCIVSCGIQSPTGIGAPMSIANVMAGISRITRNKTILDTKFAPVSLGTAQYLENKLPNSTRMVSLLIPALKEALEALQTIATPFKNIPLVLGLPKQRPGLDQALTGTLKTEIAEFNLRSKVQLIPEFICSDHDSGIMALNQAEQFLRENRSEMVLVGGVDSFISAKTIAWLEREGQLYCSANKNGYTPGEAAACFLVCAEKTALAYKLPIRAKVLKTATVKEPSASDPTLVNAGKGVSQAVAQVLAQLPEAERVQEIFCTLKGVRTEAKEFAFGMMEVGPRFEKPGEFTSLCQRWGDIGAASAPALIGYALEKRALEFAEGGYQLILTLSPGGSRSTALIRTT